MQIGEFDNQFDVLYNNITSNQAPGLNTYEKSLFLTKAQDEIVKNHFLPQSNPKQAGFDDNQKRQADFSCLMKVADLDPVSTPTSSKFVCISTTAQVKEFPPEYFTFKNGDVAYTLNAGTYTIASATTITVDDNTITVSPALPFSSGSFVMAAAEASIKKVDSRSTLYSYPNDVFIPINEVAQTTTGKTLQVIPIRYDDYTLKMSKPFKRPLKNQAWRLINSGINTDGNAATKYVELIAGAGETVTPYTIRYVRKPKPIIVGDLDGLTINGYYLENGTQPTDSVGTAIATDGNCELDPMVHEEILQRAVELAKIAWTATGNDNIQAEIQAGQRSE